MTPLPKSIMIQSYQNKKALLLGNGINLLDSTQSYSWGQLLQELRASLGIDVDLENIFKPFPLAFEEMLHQKPGDESFKEKIKTLKQKIRRSIDNQLLGKKGFNDYHSKVVNMGYDDILTTNYDYSLQKSVVNNFFKVKNTLAVNKQEPKYSLKRCYKLSDIHSCRIWHIHGELFDSRSLSEKSKYYKEESIMIGYEHYASYLNLIQKKTIGLRGYQKEIEDQSLMVRLTNKPNTSPFWIDIFFTHNLDIVGQGLDFSENHLWWLINHRANTMRQTKPKHDVEINNTIRFFYPQIDGKNLVDINEFNDFDKIIRRKNDFNKSKAIAEVLKAFEVIPQPVRCETYQDFYDQVISLMSQ